MDARILLVEDDPSIRELTERGLHGAGFDVLTAATGDEGLERFRGDRPDLVVLDVMLPGLDGLEVCRAIRADSAVPVVMLTARSDTIDVVVGLEAGADDYVMLAGDHRPFYRAAAGALIRRDVERARSVAALQNHDAIPSSERWYGTLSTITAPTLVIHGTADPMFPAGHGEALAAEILGARLLLLEGAGHGVDRADWQATVTAVVEHTAPADRADVW